MNHLGKLFASLGLAALVAASPVSAQSVGDFYKGKQVEFIVAADAGSSHDTWTRVLAKYFTKYLPGNPTFIVKNMPGAGHIVGTNYLYNRAPKDGLSIGLVSDQMPLTGALKNKDSLQADFTKFFFIGSPDRPWQVCVARPEAKIKKAEDVMTNEMLVGGNGAGSAISFIPTFVNAVLGWKFKIIDGYKGSQDIMLAMDRGELDGVCQAYQGVQHGRPGAIQSGALNLLLTLEPEPIAGTAAPSISTFAKTDEQRQMIRFQQSANLGRSVLAPPGTPTDRVEALRRAFDAMFKDKDFLQDVDKAGLDPAPSTGEQQVEKYKALASTPPDIMKKAVALLGQ